MNLKKEILNLIRYHYDKDDVKFERECKKIIRYWDTAEDYQLADYIMAQMGYGEWVPQ